MDKSKSVVGIYYDTNDHNVTSKHKTPPTNRFSNITRRPLSFSMSVSLLLGLGTMLVGCGEDHKNSNNPAADTIALVADPIIKKTFTASELKDAITLEGFNGIADPVCGISVHYMNHTTKGVANEPTNATGAVIIPKGIDIKCQGERPISLYAHGTESDKNYNLAALDDPSNPAYSKALYVAATYSGQGDIVIAPNYPGYGESTLDYIPYNTAKQGEQMLDALAAGKLTVDKINKRNKSLPSQTATYNDKLFISGFSQGGYVAMATAKRLDEMGTPATAISPSSGAYALSAFGDSIMAGNVISGGTIFLPMLGASYNKEFTNDDSNDSPFDDIYSAKYSDAPSLFPTDGSVTGLFAIGKLPISQLFQASPTGIDILETIPPPSPLVAYGFDTDNYLFSTTFRADYVNDMKKHPDGLFPTATDAAALPEGSENLVRQAFIKNDLRHYKPKAPALLCGGNQDASVKFDINSTSVARLWEKDANTIFAMVDMDVTNRDSRASDGKTPYMSTLPTAIDNAVASAVTTLQADFANTLTTMLTNSYQVAYANAIATGKSDADGKLEGEVASYTTYLYRYHASLHPYCMRAANTFFEQYR